MRRGITAEIDLTAALKNLEVVRRTVSGLPVIAVVKADAYGHGAAELSRLYEDAGVYALAVAFVSEAEELRADGISSPILVLFDNTEPEKFFDLSLTPVIHDIKTAGALSREAQRRGTTLAVHVKVDTGMGRVGLDGKKDVIKVLGMKGLSVAGLMSHLSEAELEDMDFVELQLKRFNALRESLRAKGLTPLCHIANSAAVCSHPGAHLDAVRPGLVLYGINPLGEGRPAVEVHPVMRVRAPILTLRRLDKGHPVSYGRTFITRRPTLAAVLAAGYADGYNRLFSNSAHVIIRGKRAPIIGRVCMDITLADVTDISGVTENDDALLMGAERGEEISAAELASRASTIPYEVLLHFGTRARRLYSRIPVAAEGQV